MIRRSILLLALLSAPLLAARPAPKAAPKPDRYMSITTLTFSMPLELTPACADRMNNIASGVDAVTTLLSCDIPYQRSEIGYFKNRMVPEFWPQTLAMLPVGKPRLMKKDGKTLVMVVDREGPAAQADEIPVDRILYEGELSPAVMQALGPVQTIDGVAKVFTDAHMQFAREAVVIYPTVVGTQTTADLAAAKPGEPLVVQMRADYGYVYAKRK